MFALTMIVIGIVLLGLFFLFGGHRSRLKGASKKIKLATDVAPEPLGESLHHADERASEKEAPPSTRRDPSAA
jgi:hypothetical protein